MYRWIEVTHDSYVPYSGICPRCYSADFWDDVSAFGCNKCGWMSSQ